MIPVSMTLGDSDSDFKVASAFEIKYVKMVQDRAIDTTEPK